MKGATPWVETVAADQRDHDGEPHPQHHRLQVRIERLQPVVLGAGLAVVIALVAATVSSQGVAPFIYFRF